MPDPVASVVVLAWPPSQKRSRNVFTFLETLPSGIGREWLEVVVVCNGDAPALGERLSRHPCVDRLVRLPVNAGVPAGWNHGARIARGDVFVFANEDLRLGTSTLANLVRAVGDEDVGLAGIHGDTWDPVRMWPARARRARARGVFGPAGMLLAVRADVWSLIGGVDERLSPAFFEEVDLSFRVDRAGLRSVVVADPEVEHVAGVSSTKRRRQVIEWGGSKAATVARIHRRNHRLMLETWSPAKWRSERIVHLVLYTGEQGRLLATRGAARVARLLRRARW